MEERSKKLKKLFDLTQRHYEIMKNKNILVCVYTNACGFLWSMMMVDSGTDLGWSNENGDCKESGTFTSYDKALENALNLIDQCDLKQFQNEISKDKFHWSNYANHLIENYEKKIYT